MNPQNQFGIQGYGLVHVKFQTSFLPISQIRTQIFGSPHSHIQTYAYWHLLRMSFVLWYFWIPFLLTPQILTLLDFPLYYLSMFISITSWYFFQPWNDLIFMQHLKCLLFTLEIFYFGFQQTSLWPPLWSSVSLWKTGTVFLPSLCPPFFWFFLNLSSGSTHPFPSLSVHSSAWVHPILCNEKSLDFGFKKTLVQTPDSPFISFVNLGLVL